MPNLIQSLNFSVHFSNNFVFLFIFENASKYYIFYNMSSFVGTFFKFSISQLPSPYLCFRNKWPKYLCFLSSNNFYWKLHFTVSKRKWCCTISHRISYIFCGHSSPIVLSSARISCNQICKYFMRKLEIKYESELHLQLLQGPNRLLFRRLFSQPHIHYALNREKGKKEGRRENEMTSLTLKFNRVLRIGWAWG